MKTANPSVLAMENTIDPPITPHDIMRLCSQATLSYDISLGTRKSRKWTTLEGDGKRIENKITIGQKNTILDCLTTWIKAMIKKKLAIAHDATWQYVGSKTRVIPVTRFAFPFVCLWCKTCRQLGRRSGICRGPPKLPAEPMQ